MIGTTYWPTGLPSHVPLSYLPSYLSTFQPKLPTSWSPFSILRSTYVLIHLPTYFTTHLRSRLPYLLTHPPNHLSTYLLSHPSTQSHIPNLTFIYPLQPLNLLVYLFPPTHPYSHLPTSTPTYLFSDLPTYFSRHLISNLFTIHPSAHLLSCPFTYLHTQILTPSYLPTSRGPRSNSVDFLWGMKELWGGPTVVFTRWRLELHSP